MRFKKLELLGFKSFAETTELTFEPGVTAVVGPNGCGKSNVADAIKWVLGEQSPRELRGGRMEDLIFNGSDRRDPIHYAEVSLTLDNSEGKLSIPYSEITISRRLFRTGESEYLLNRNAVRLRDIQELLMGTGIGTSAYSLFEQGRIEQIISARPEDRRAIFEEAAGITKFKSQKREAMRRLEETEENLTRVSDVIAEVKRQIQTLERQVRRAKSYKEQMEELKRLELHAARRETARLTALWQEKEAALRGFREQVAGAEQQSGSQEERLAQVRARVAQAEEAFAQAREAFLAVSHRQETMRGNLQMNRERIAEGQARSAAVHAEIAEAGSQIERLERQAQELSALAAQEQADRKAKEERIAQHQAQLERCARIVEEAQGSITQARGRLLDATGAQVQVKNQLARVRQESARLEARAGRLQMEKGKVTQEWQEAAERARGLDQDLLEARTVMEQMEQERKVCQENLSATQNSLDQMERDVSALDQEMTRVSSQLEALKGLLAAHEGYSSGVKQLLTALDQGRLGREGIVGVLAELIQVNRADAAAVDAALGPWAEGVVVESAEAAERCRRFLEENKAGRVLFLIRDQVRDQVPFPAGTGSAGEPVPPGNGTVRTVRLSDRIGITPHLTALLNLLLGETWLVADRRRAQEEAARLQPGERTAARFITPDGELYMAASQLLGPAPSEESLIVGRMSRLQSLEVAHAHVEGKLQEGRQALGALHQQRREQEDAFTSFEASVQQKAEELHRMEENVSSARAAVEKLQQELEVLKAEEMEAAAELKEIHSELDRWEKENAAKEQELQAHQDGIQQGQETIAQTVKMREEISVTLATAKAEQASFEEVASSRRSSLQVLQQSLQAARSQAQARREELGKWEGRQAELESGCAQLERQLLDLEAEKAGSREGVERAQQHRSEALKAASAQEQQFLSVQKGLEISKSQLHAQEMEQAQVNFQKEQVTNRLLQVYQISLEEAAPDPEEGSLQETGEEEMRARISELSEKLQRMGPVNLASIDEERDLQNRFEFLTTQQGDLLKAKEDLHQALARINRTTRAMFRETFQAIQQQFQVTFKQLFGGGEARLILMDEEDVLESGIEIIARPPGKPLQPISLLSGGEKALTTIALLFAIFRIKPSPFCVLDEIDAPLDEANIDRFTRALREFLKDSQFIIITHNKKTMAMADVLYGITMQEVGVSRIVSVKFRGQVAA